MDIDQSLGQIRARLRDTKEDQPLSFIGRISRLLHCVRRIQQRLAQTPACSKKLPRQHLKLIAKLGRLRRQVIERHSSRKRIARATRFFRRQGRCRLSLQYLLSSWWFLICPSYIAPECAAEVIFLSGHSAHLPPGPTHGRPSRLGYRARRCQSAVLT